jgi:iron complex transport system permease protein
MKPVPVLRLGGWLALPYHRASLRYCLVAVLVGLGVAVATMLGGQYQLDASEIWTTLTQGGDPVDVLIVLGLRLPRIVAAMLVGLALGASGAIFQGVSRNSLASPDLIGFTTGSATGALVVIVLMGESNIGVTLGTLIGGFGTAMLAYLFAWGRGERGDRLILIGIAIGAMLGSVNDILLTRADLEKAQAAKTWLFGSLHAIGWPVVGPLAVAVAILLPLALLMAPRLRMLEMGDDLAGGLGVPVARARPALIAVAIGLAATAIAAAGPIGFVALAAPQLARRISRTPGIGVGTSAVTGAVLVLLADLVAQRALAPFQIPVGLVTGAIGGLYLTTLLLADWFRPTGRS